jgi:5-methylcytosine-specific restriction endonuclease McrA
MIVFARMNRATPLYLVAGSTSGAMGAKKALKLAHRLHGGNCFFCKEPIAGEPTIDHAQPTAGGGGPEIQNLLIACDPCNKTKGAKAIELFDPKAGREWLSAVLHQVQARLNRL